MGTKILGLLWLLLSAAAFAGGRSEPEDARVERIFADLSTTQAGPGCAVSVRLGGNIIHRRGYGVAERKSLRKISPKTRFRLASVTKTMVAITVAKLAEERREEGEPWLLDRTLTSIFGAFRDAAAGGITVRQLLSHTAGLPRDFDSLAMHVANPTDADVVTWLRTEARPLVLFPGGRHDYSNVGFGVLGAIIEKISGQPLEQAVRTRLFDPLGMRQATMRRADLLTDDEHLATGYVKVGGGWTRAPLTFRTCGILGKGGIHATTNDLEKLDQAIAARSLLKPETWAELFRPVGLVQEGKDVPYALGWSVGAEGQWHTGYWTGFMTLFYRVEKADCRMTAIVLCNDDGAGPLKKPTSAGRTLQAALCP